MRATLSTLLILTSGICSATATTAVTFAPPQGEARREYRMAAQTTLDGAPALSTLVQTVRQLRIRSTRHGWEIQSVPQDMRIDGLIPELDRKIQEMLLSQAFTLNLHADGSLRSVNGFDKLEGEVRHLIPAPMRKTVASVLNPQTQRQRVAAHWETELAWLIGKELSPGQTFIQEREILHDGNTRLDFHQESTITAIEQVEDKTLITVNFSSRASPGEPLRPGPLRALNITETGWRTLDAATGMPREEEATRIITMTLFNGSQEILQERTETRRVTHHYSQDRD